MQFEKDYFDNRCYTLKEKIVKRHILEVVRWASKASDGNLLDGTGKRVLDVGCAYGYAASVLETLGYEVYSIDISRWGVKQAKNNNPNSDFLVCDSQGALPFAAEAFDLVTCFDVLEHLQFPEKAIQSMLEVCRGSMVCTTPSKVEKPVRKLIGDYDETHINVRSPSQWKRTIKQNGNCKLVCVETFYDVSAQLDGLFFYKSFRVPALGLTVRILVGK